MEISVNYGKLYSRVGMLKQMNVFVVGAQTFLFAISLNKDESVSSYNFCIFKPYNASKVSRCIISMIHFLQAASS